MPGILSMWTIYNHPADYPNYFVARRWEVQAGKESPTTDVLLDVDLDKLRAKLPPGLYCLPRFQGDDPVIMEVWL